MLLLRLSLRHSIQKRGPELEIMWPEPPNPWPAADGNRILRGSAAEAHTVGRQASGVRRQRRVTILVGRV